MSRVVIEDHYLACGVLGELKVKIVGTASADLTGRISADVTNIYAAFDAPYCLTLKDYRPSKIVDVYPIVKETEVVKLRSLVANQFLTDKWRGKEGDMHQAAKGEA